MNLFKLTFLFLLSISLAACVAPSRYDRHDEIVRTSREMANASSEYYEQLARDEGRDEATRKAAELVEESRIFHDRVLGGYSYELTRQDFEEVAEAYALAQNELATRRDLYDNPRLADDFRRVEIAFGNLNEAIGYTSSDDYEDRDTVGYRDPDYRDRDYRDD